MAYSCYVVLHQKPEQHGKRKLYGSDQPDGYHSSQQQAEAARVRWAKRRPECRWRVAELNET